MNSSGSQIRFLRSSILSALAAAILFAAGVSTGTALAAGDTATVTFRKVFKQSFPEFVEIKVSENGQATYDIRQLDEQANPQPFAVSRPLLEKIFQLAAQLHHFDGPSLDIHRKIANLGEKTFRYEKGSEVHETTFNYTLDTSAGQLLDLFEGLGREQIDLTNLERAMRYDRLGVNDAVVRLETDYNNKLIPEPDRLLASLDQLAADEKYLDIARQKARTLAGRIRNPR
jgi:hypothetical protein